MDATPSKQAKKEVMKDIIRELHRGLSAEAAKERFEKEVGSVTSSEIAEIEQSLINDGLSPDEIKKFCNVHALIFQSALEKSASPETFPSHPVYLFRLENREVEKLTREIREVAENKTNAKLGPLKKSLRDIVFKLKGVETHYERKEHLLFPYLERQGFMGPSKVMWGKDNEVRDLFKAALADLEGVNTDEELQAYVKKALDPLLEEIEGMIFKEENILFPTSVEKLSAEDWVDILSESEDVGYVFIEKPLETDMLVKEFREALQEEPIYQDNSVSLPTGSIQLKELMAILNTLPFDLTFVDNDDTVRYFSAGKDRIFRRTKSVIGRKVQNCHPPQSLDVVEKILTSFKEGKRDDFDFWINFRDRMAYIRYFALRDNAGHYLGTVEVTQDITDVKKLEGEKRLVDETA